MFKKKNALTSTERNIIINSLVEWRNNRIQEGKAIDAINDVLLKLLEASKEIKI
jgi:hypothetical protein